MATKQHIADKGPKVCCMCPSTHVLRTVGSKGYCKAHQEQAFTSGRQAGNGKWESGNQFTSGNQFAVK